MRIRQEVRSKKEDVRGKKQEDFKKWKSLKNHIAEILKVRRLEIDNSRTGRQ